LIESRRVRLSRQRRIADDPSPRRSIDVVAGDGFDLTLADLPGAGYVWTPVDVPAGLTLIETQSTAETTTDIVGSAQSKVVRFQAERAGDYEIVFIFARPWENVPAETQIVRVRVREREAEESR